MTVDPLAFFANADSLSLTAGDGDHAELVISAGELGYISLCLEREGAGWAAHIAFVSTRRGLLSCDAHGTGERMRSPWLHGSCQLRES